MIIGQDSSGFSFFENIFVDIERLGDVVDRRGVLLCATQPILRVKVINSYSEICRVYFVTINVF